MIPATESADWLALIRAEPENDIPRLVYAQYLDESGDPDGELVRLLCEVQRPTEVTCPTCGGEGWHVTETPKLELNKSCQTCGTDGRIVVAFAPTAVWDRMESLTGGVDAVTERLSERDRRLFACDCAERVLPLFEREYPGDERPRRAVETARRYACGEATGAETQYASGNAARAATGHRLVGTNPCGNVIDACIEAALLGSVSGPLAAIYAATAAADPAAERRWQLCRAVEYRLNFMLVQGSSG